MHDIDKPEDLILLSEKEIFTKIWTSPRLVFSFIKKTDYTRHLYLLAFLVGITRALDRASLKNLGDTMSLPTLLIISVLFSNGESIATKSSPKAWVLNLSSSEISRELGLATLKQCHLKRSYAYHAIRRWCRLSIRK